MVQNYRFFFYAKNHEVKIMIHEDISKFLIIANKHCIAKNFIWQL